MLLLFTANPRLARLLSQIKEQNTQIIEQNKVILSVLNERSNTGTALRPENLPRELPLEDENDLNKTEEFLKNPLHFNGFVSIKSFIFLDAIYGCTAYA